MRSATPQSWAPCGPSEATGSTSHGNETRLAKSTDDRPCKPSMAAADVAFELVDGLRLLVDDLHEKVAQGQHA